MAGERPDVQKGKLAVTQQRPANHKPPVLSKSPPVPQPGPPADEAEALSPTRYGDWEKKGIAIDF
jgi:hypothetical protein